MNKVQKIGLVIGIVLLAQWNPPPGSPGGRTGPLRIGCLPAEAYYGNNNATYGPVTYGSGGAYWNTMTSPYGTGCYPSNNGYGSAYSMYYPEVGMSQTFYSPRGQSMTLDYPELNSSQTFYSGF